MEYVILAVVVACIFPIVLAIVEVTVLGERKTCEEFKRCKHKRCKGGSDE